MPNRNHSENDALYTNLADPEAHPALHLSELNPFVPTEARTPEREVMENVVPDKVLEKESMVLYRSEDFEFLRHKIRSNFKLHFPTENMAPRFKVLLDLYTTCVKDSPWKTSTYSPTTSTSTPSSKPWCTAISASKTRWI